MTRRKRPDPIDRGIVLAVAMPEGAEYAAAAVADRVCFKTYQVTLRFSDLEL